MKKFTLEDFIQRAIDIHGDDCIYDKTEYNNIYENILIGCNINPEHGYFLQRATNHLQGRGCPKCGFISKRIKTTHQFIKEAKEIHGNACLYDKVEYEHAHKKVLIGCNKNPDHGYFWQTPNKHLISKFGCPLCSIYINSKNKIKTTEQFINEANDIHGEGRYLYHKTEYEHSKKKVIITCPIEGHGDFEQRPLNHLQGHGCPICNKSKGEIKIENWLKTNFIRYKPQKTFNGLKYKTLLYVDFFLLDYNIVIEYDGKQHFESIDFFGGDKTLKENQIKDNLKNEYFKEHNIKIIRIPYTEFEIIEEILKKELKDIIHS